MVKKIVLSVYLSHFTNAFQNGILDGYAKLNSMGKEPWKIIWCSIEKRSAEQAKRTQLRHHSFDSHRFTHRALFVDNVTGVRKNDFNK